MKTAKRWIVEECVQPGFGSEDWAEVGRFATKAQARKSQSEAGHFVSRSIFDDMKKAVVSTGWRIGE